MFVGIFPQQLIMSDGGLKLQTREQKKEQMNLKRYFQSRWPTLMTKRKEKHTRNRQHKHKGRVFHLEPDFYRLCIYLRTRALHTHPTPEKQV